MKRIILLPLIILVNFAFAQKAIEGSVLNTDDAKALHNASIVILDTDSIMRHFARADESGKFAIENIKTGSYILLISYPKFITYSQPLALQENNVKLGAIQLQSESNLIEEIVVTRSMPIKMKGDTLEYNAGSFETEKNAKLEDLLRRLPGLTVSPSGEITAQGKTVSKVLIDGEEFFGYDPKIAIRNVRADAIDKVQVYERKSDDAELTGIDDGVRLQTVNVVLKEEARTGIFGNANANVGTKDLFDANLFAGFFNKAERVGVTRNWNNMGSSGDASHIRSNRQITGKPEHKNVGANYENNFLEKKLHLTSSYNFNNNSNENESENYNRRVLTDEKSQETRSKSASSSDKQNHSIRSQIRYRLDSLSNLNIRLNAARGSGENSSSSNSETIREDASLANDFKSKNVSSSDNNNFNFNTNYRRRLNSKGRSMNVSFSTQHNNDNSTSRVEETTNLYDDAGQLESSKKIDQLRENESSNNQLSAGINISEPISERMFLTMGYNFSNTSRRSTVDAYNQTDGAGFDKRDSLYSKNEIDRNSNNTADLSLRYSTDKFNVSVTNRINYRQQELEDTYRDIALERTFWQNNLNADAFYRFSNNKTLNLRYSNSTNVPSFNQLQRIQPPTNELYVQVGNPNLKREKMNGLNVNFNQYSLLKGSSFNINMSTSFTGNAIANKSTTDDKGKTTATFVNLSEQTNWNANVHTNYTRPYFNGLVQIGPMASLNYDNTYQYVNDELNKNNTARGSLGIGANKQTSKLIDFNFSLNMNITNEENSVQTQYNATSFGSSINTDIKYFLPFKFNLTQVIHYGYTGKTKAFPEPIKQFYMNLELTRKLLPSESLLLSLKGFDVFNSFNNTNRSSSGNNFSQTQQQLLTQYFMIGLKWDFNKNLGKKNG